MGVHDGHRERKKKQFREHGLDAFADHEALELLLYYAIPQKDTNPVAHALIDRFGSLDGVLSAPYEELVKVNGISEHGATLLTLIFPLVRRARTSGTKEPVILNSTRAAGAYFCDLFFGMKAERLYMACLDAKGKLLRCCAFHGSVGAVDLNMRYIVQNAIEQNASAVILSHNHPSGIALPSPDDNATTLMVWDALHTVGIELIDHIIVADGDFVSLRDNGLLPPR